MDELPQNVMTTDIFLYELGNIYEKIVFYITEFITSDNLINENNRYFYSLEKFKPGGF